MSQINGAFGKPMYEADPTNARYNSLQLQCYEQRKEIDRLRERIKRLEEAGDEMHRWCSNPRIVGGDTEAADEWREAKEAKP